MSLKRKWLRNRNRELPFNPPGLYTMMGFNLVNGVYALVSEDVQLAPDPLGNLHPIIMWNPIGGQCKHGCKYCAIRKVNLPKYRGEPQILDRLFDIKLGEAELINVGCQTDIWGDWIPNEWIERILAHCRKYDRLYWFQTKNPKRYLDFLEELPARSILGTTVETNKNYYLSNAPPAKERMEAMSSLPEGVEKLVSISPIVNFDLDTMISWIERINPTYALLGRNTTQVNLPEPGKGKAIKLAKEITEIIYITIGF